MLCPKYLFEGFLCYNLRLSMLLLTILCNMTCLMMFSEVLPDCQELGLSLPHLAWPLLDWRPGYTNASVIGCFFIIRYNFSMSWDHYLVITWRYIFFIKSNRACKLFITKLILERFHIVVKFCPKRLHFR